MTTPNPSREAEPPGGSSPPADEAAASRRSRKPVLLLILLGALALAAAYLLPLWRARGEYLYELREAAHITLTMRGLPQWSNSADPLTAAPSLYYLGLDGISLTYPATSASATSERIVLRHLADDEYRYYYPDRSPDWFLRVEWFPPGSLGRLRDVALAASPADALPLLDAARDLHARLPRRLTTRYWLVAALCLAGQRAEAATLLERWRPDFAAATSPRARRMLLLMELDLAAAEPAVEAAFERFLALLPEGTKSVRMTLQEMIEWVSGFDAADVPRRRSMDWRNVSPEAFESIVEIALTWAHLLLVDGRHDEAHRLLLGLYSFTERMPIADPLGEQHVLLKWRERLAYSMISLYAAGEWSAPRLEADWRDWEALWPTLRRHDDPLAIRGINPELATLADLRARIAKSPAGSVGDEEARVAMQVLRAEVRREFFREMVRVRHAQVVSGEWPETDETWSVRGVLLASPNPPLDPFSDPPRPFRANATQAMFGLWSVGPDGDDDRAQDLYDPTNGLVSSGDIVSVMPRKPTFRFPADPGHEYAGRAELDARYPMGLPWSDFSNPSSAIQVTTDGSDLLWSYGPDRDEATHAANVLPGQQVDVLYDPTNGIASRGDLYLKLTIVDDGQAEGEAAAGAAGASNAE